MNLGVNCLSEKSVIAGPAGDLEILLECPDVAPKAVMVIAHPHPLYGGTMQNKVVHTLARGALNSGVAALRLNFRGVGKSGGSYDEGRGERHDLLAVVAWAKQRFPGLPLWLSGFSFGAGVAMLTTEQAGAERLLVVAPPLNLYPDLRKIKQIDMPWSVLMGDEDEVVPFSQVSEWVEQQQIPPNFMVFSGATHFFHGRLVELRGVVEEFCL